MSRFVTLAAMVVAVIGVLAAAPVAGASPGQPVGRGAQVFHVAVIGDSYTTGTDMGGLGATNWAARTWDLLNRRGVQVAPDVAAEGAAGYVVRGNRNGIFIDSVGRAVRGDDDLVVFFGSRNDRGVDPQDLATHARDAFALAHRIAPRARLLVIGPPWPTADVPPDIWQVRDVLNRQAQMAGANFVDPLVERWFVGPPGLIGPDGVHPTDAGHAYLADRIAPLITAQLPGSV